MSELKEREHLVITTLDQARTFLADQPIEGPAEPRKNLQPKTGDHGNHCHMSGATPDGSTTSQPIRSKGQFGHFGDIESF